MSTRRAIHSTRTKAHGGSAAGRDFHRRRMPLPDGPGPAPRCRVTVNCRRPHPTHAAVGVYYYEGVHGVRQCIQVQWGTSARRHRQASPRKMEFWNNTSEKREKSRPPLPRSAAYRGRCRSDLFAYPGNMSYFCRVLTDPPPPPTDSVLRYASAPARNHPNPNVQPNENEASAARRIPRPLTGKSSREAHRSAPRHLCPAAEPAARFRRETITQ